MPASLSVAAVLLIFTFMLPAIQPALGQDMRTLIAGRAGWAHEGDAWQGLLRAELSEPEAPGQTVGALVLACDGRGYRLYVSVDARRFQRLPDPRADGIVHIRSDRGHAVSLYAVFDGPTSFRSRASAATGAGEAGALIDLLFEANRTLMLTLSPRPATRRLVRPIVMRLILEPGDMLAGADLNEALLGFSADCEGRER